MDKHKCRSIKRVNKSRIENLKKGHDPDSSVQQSFSTSTPPDPSISDEHLASTSACETESQTPSDSFPPFPYEHSRRKTGCGTIAPSSRTISMQGVQKKHPIFSA